MDCLIIDQAVGDRFFRIIREIAVNDQAGVYWLEGGPRQDTVNEVDVFTVGRNDKARISGSVIKTAMVAEDIAVKQGITALFGDKIAVEEAGYTVGI